jgi:hypothetical protein
MKGTLFFLNKTRPYALFDNRLEIVLHNGLVNTRRQTLRYQNPYCKNKKHETRTFIIPANIDKRISYSLKRITRFWLINYFASYK